VVYRRGDILRHHGKRAAARQRSASALLRAGCASARRCKTGGRRNAARQLRGWRRAAGGRRNGDAAGGCGAGAQAALLHGTTTLRALRTPRLAIRVSSGSCAAAWHMFAVAYFCAAWRVYLWASCACCLPASTLLCDGRTDWRHACA